MNITGLELPDKRLDQVYSQENPIVWAKKATHSKIRFAVHDGDQTHSYKEEFEVNVEFNKGMKIQRSAKGQRNVTKRPKLNGGAKRTLELN